MGQSRERRAHRSPAEKHIVHILRSQERNVRRFREAFNGPGGRSEANFYQNIWHLTSIRSHIRSLHERLRVLRAPSVPEPSEEVPKGALVMWNSYRLPDEWVELQRDDSEAIYSDDVAAAEHLAPGEWWFFDLDEPGWRGHWRQGMAPGDWDRSLRVMIPLRVAIAQGLTSERQYKAAQAEGCT